jgi:CheY-like chemotaxis protein
MRPTPSTDPLHLESLRFAEQQESVDLAELATNLLPILNSLAQGLGVSLRTCLPSALPGVRANPTLLRQILLSLASHAISHVLPCTLTFVADTSVSTPDMAGSGTTVYRVGWHLQARSTDSPALLRPGNLLADPDALPTLAAALGGHLQVEPDAENGAYLWVWLPQSVHRSVLVIDDNQDLLELFRRYLAGHPYQVRSAASVDEGLAQVRRAIPDAVVLDLMMPGRDGWELLSALRQDAVLRSVPVIVCSVLYEPELAHALGAQRVLKKPIGAAELLATLAAVLPEEWRPAQHPAALADSAALAKAAAPPAHLV